MTTVHPYPIFHRYAAAILWVAMLLCIPVFVRAQVLPPEFQVVRGPQNFILGKINGLTQDRQGYIWMAEQRTGCLTRFDGHTFKRYYHELDNPNSLHSAFVETIAADSNGHIWIGYGERNFGGVDRFDPVSETFTHFASDHKEVHGMSARFVNQIMVDHRGVVWVGTSEGLFRFDATNNRFTQYAHREGDKTSLSSDMVRSLYEDRSGTLWVGTGIPFDLKNPSGGLNRLDQETGQFTQYLHDPKNPSSLINNKVRAIFEDSRGNFWVGTQGDGLHLMDRKTGRFTRMTYNPTQPDALSRPLPHPTNRYDHITFITEDVTGALWIGTYSEGLVRYDTVSKKITRFKAETSRPIGFADSTSWCSFISRDGTLWISTENGNLYTIDPRRTQITYHDINGWSWAVYEESPHTLWAIINGFGLKKLEREKQNLRLVAEYPIPNLINTDGRITDIFPLDSDRFRVSSFHGLYTFMKKEARYISMDLWDSTLGKPLTSMETTRPMPGGSYFSVGLGLARINTRGKIEKIYRKNPADPDAISSDTLICSAYEGDHTLYIGTLQQGINALDLRTEKFRHYLPSSTVYGVLVTREGDAWAATGAGLYRKKKDSADFIAVVFNESDLQKASFYGLTEDKQGKLWGPSSVGIFRIDPKDETYSIYGMRSGVTEISNQARSKALTLSDGNIVIGCLSGLYMFNPEQAHNTAAPIIHLQALRVGNQENAHPYLNERSLNLDSLEQIRLKHSENTFTIHFTAIQFNDLRDNVIEYMLENYDRDWHRPGPEPSAFYFNVQPGKYVFRIRARSSYGVWSEKSIPLVVLPPWWMTWWAYLLYTLLFLAAIWGFIRWRTESLRKEKLVLETKVRERTKELEKEKSIVEETLGELKATQTQLIQSEKMASLGELTAGIAHEIQNPLNFVNNFSELNLELLDEMQSAMQKGDSDEARTVGDEIAENMRKIHAHGKRADSIVKNMLQHSRKGSGQREMTDINALADEYLRLAFHGMRARDKSFQAQLVTHFDKDLRKIPVVPQDLGRVLLNLFNNAFYAVQEKSKNADASFKPTITVRTAFTEIQAPKPHATNTARSGSVHITVEDNGIGISEKNMEKIFQPFFTTKPAGEGTGLGLSLSYDIITKGHGGTLTASTVPGEGSRFVISIPV